MNYSPRCCRKLHSAPGRTLSAVTPLRGERTRAVLRRPTDFVALVEGDREFTRLTNRGALLEDIAAVLGEEPEGGSD